MHCSELSRLTRYLVDFAGEIFAAPSYVCHFWEGQGSVFAPIATVHHGRLPSSPVKCHFWQGCVGVSRCMPHHLIFFWSPLCIYTAHFVLGLRVPVRPLLDVLPLHSLVCTWCFICFGLWMPRSFNPASVHHSWDPVELLYSYIPWPFFVHFYVCRYTRFLRFIFVVGTISLSIFLVIL